MTRVAIFDKHMWLMGGGERVVASILECLRRFDYEVTIYTGRAFDIHAFEDRLNKNLHDITIRTKQFFKNFSNFTRSIRTYPLLFDDYLMRRVDGEEVFIDLTPNSLPAYTRIPDIVYWQDPLFPPIHNGEYLAAYHNDWFIKRVIKRIFYFPYILATKRMLTKITKPRFIFCNSKYIQSILGVYGIPAIKTEVLYPPVNLLEWQPPYEDERDGIVSLSRFATYKRHDWQIHIARGLNKSLTMIGSAIHQGERETLIQLMTNTSPNIHFLVNQNIKKVKEKLWKSKVFLHTAKAESFGVATVEAIASGCIPIVFNTAGNRETVPFDELRFDTINEGREKVKKAFNGEFDHLIPKLREHIKRFNESKFQARILEAVRSCSR
ncbi:MAG: glycosyltransferase [archaeon]|nr:glycosyltransferase [archaeon]